MIDQQTTSIPEQKGARLRQRLIGGMVIVAIGALLLPLWLDTGGLKTPTVEPVPTPPKVSQPEQINIPAPAASQIQTLQTPPPVDSSLSNANTTPVEAVAPAPTVTAPPLKPVLSRPTPPVNSTAESRPVEPARAANEAEKTPVNAPPRSVSAPVITHPSNEKAEDKIQPPVSPPVQVNKTTQNGEWVVQLGSFSDELNARALAKSVEEAGFHVNLSPLFAKKGTVWRVRVGPYATRDQALQTTVLLREKLGRDGLVMPNK